MGIFVLEQIKLHAKQDKTAWRCSEGGYTFAELDARSDAFAAWLIKNAGNNRAPVMIYGGKYRDFLPCVFGALKSGRAYVPVDDTVPSARAGDIAGEINPCVIVNLTDDILPCKFNTLYSDVLARILDTPPETEIFRENWIHGDDTAYILFTSGSTGKPKGVPVTAANLTVFYSGLLPWLVKNKGGAILDQVSYSFDVSCCAVYAGLSLGMTLVSVDRKMTEDVGALFAWLRTSGLTVWVSTPSFAELCIRSASFSKALMPKLDTFLFCGEVLTHKLCDELTERFPNTAVLNTYGPTEATVLVTAVRVTEEMRRDKRPIPIGRPVGGVTLALDTGPDDNQGELLILGGSVGPGYHKLPDLTAERFFTDIKTGMRGYRTGDICEVCDGLYYYRGRADNQIKINGYRVEIEDIERNLERLPNVLKAAVIPVSEDGRVQHLTAFLLLKEDDGLSHLQRAIALKKQASISLPSYMIPLRLIALEEFPLNVNGKIDKKELANRLRKEK